MEIVARGIKDGKNMTVIYDGNVFRFNGEENGMYQMDIEIEMSAKHIVAGTYAVENENDPINIANVLREYFFDKPTLDVRCSDDIQLDYKDGVIY